MSATIQHYLHFDHTEPPETSGFYDIEKNLVYLSSGVGTERYTVVGTPDQIVDWAATFQAEARRLFFNATAARLAERAVG
jgi:hypothetical protein